MVRTTEYASIDGNEYAHRTVAHRFHLHAPCYRQNGRCAVAVSVFLFIYPLPRSALETDPPPPLSPIADPSPRSPCRRVLLSRVRVCVRPCARELPRVRARVLVRACVCVVCVSARARVCMCVCNIGFYYCHQRHQPTNTPPSIRNQCHFVR